MSKTPIYFKESTHVYTNEVGNRYISATTIIGKYEHKFSDKQNEIARACAKIGRNPNHPKYRKYKGKTASQILAGWDKTREDACALGNSKHDYLERSVKGASGFYDVFGSKYGGSSNPDTQVRLYTIEDVIDNPDSGKLNLDYFRAKGVHEKYPKIYNILVGFVREGWRVYSEVAVFDPHYLISGLIDILLVKGDKFIILDWKTNRHDVRFEAGYWDKDNDGNVIGYKPNDEKFRYPLHELALSTGNKYSLQLSLYAYLTERFGLTHVTNILCHIRHEPYSIGDTDLTANPEWLGKNKVDIMPMPYLMTEIQSMIYDYEQVRSQGQVKMFR